MKRTFAALLFIAAMSTSLAANTMRECADHLKKILGDFTTELENKGQHQEAREIRTEYGSAHQSSDCYERKYQLAFRFADLLFEQGKVSDAKGYLEKYGDTKRFYSFIHGVYKNEPSRLVDIFKLFSKIPCSKYGLGIWALTSRMQSDARNDQLTNPGMILVLNRYMEKTGCSDDENVKKAKSFIKPHVDSILAKWAQDIRDGNFNAIYDFARFSNLQSDSFELVIGSLVQTVLSHSTTFFNTTLSFVRGVPHLQSFAPGSTAIASELHSMGKAHSEEMLLLAYHVHDLTVDNANTILASDNLSKQYAILKNSIPSQLQDIFWKSTCSIKNAHLNEYLYATNELGGDGGNGEIYSWIPGNKLSAGEWSIMSVVVSGRFVFLLKPKNLHGDTYYLCESRRTYRVITCNSTETGWRVWYMKPVFWNGQNVFLLKNSPLTNGHPDYMKAGPNYDAGLQRREVNNADLDDSSNWNIECV